MSRGKKLIKGSALNIILLLMNIGISFYMMPFLISSLGDKMYGLWVLIASFIGYYGFLDLGISIAVGRFISKAVGANAKEEQNIIIGTSLYLFCIIGLCSFVLTLVFSYFSPTIIKNINDIDLLRKLIFIVGLTTSISFPAKVFTALLDAKLRFDIINYIKIGVLLFKTILIIICIRSGYGILSLALIMLIISITEYILTIYYSFHNGFSLSAIKYKNSYVKKIFHFSSFAFISQLADILKFHIDALVISIYLSLSLVTPYQVAMRLFQYGGQFLSSVMNVVSPIFAQEVGRKDYKALKDKFLLTTKISTVTAFFVCGGMILFADAFFQCWLKNSYDNIYKVTVILSFAGIIAMSQKPSVNVLYATAKHHYYTILNVVEGILNLVLSIILVKKYGIVGVALGTSISAIFVKLFFQPFFTCKSISLNLIKYYFYFLLTLIKLIAIGACYYFLIRNFIIPKYINIIVLSLIWAIIIFAGSIFIFNKEERVYLWGFFKKTKIKN